MENKIPLLVIAGPTASGKTACAVELAKIYDGEIAFASCIFYRTRLNCFSISLLVRVIITGLP